MPTQCPELGEASRQAWTRGLAGEATLGPGRAEGAAPPRSRSPRCGGRRETLAPGFLAEL